jgi:4-hydroxybenzoate polyprenyltransferase
VAAADGDPEVIRRLGLFLRMTRLKVVVTLWTFLLIGLARHTADLDPPRLGLAILALAAGYAVATSANDISDEAIDRVNRPRDADRPLVTGDASVVDLWRTNAVAAGVTVVAAIPLGSAAIVIVGAWLVVSYAYSVRPVRLSHRWTLAPIALSVAYVVLPYALGVEIANDRWEPADAALIAGLLVLFFARIILKDFRDRLGDERFGKPTLLFRLGKGATCMISMGGVAIGTSIVIVAIGPSAPVAALLVLCAVGVEWMLVRLARVDDERTEQVSIGIAARAGNGLLLSILAVLLLRGSGADGWTTATIIGSLVAVFAASFLDAALHPERVRIGYKA